MKVVADRTSIEVVLDIALSAVLLWGAYEQTKQIRGGDESAPSRFWYHTARASQEIAYFFGNIGVKAEDNYYNSLN